MTASVGPIREFQASHVSFMPSRDPVRHTRLLVSVRDADEAELAAMAGADLVDAKDPERGALGALTPDMVRGIVTRLAGAVATSAVAGEPDIIDVPAACGAARAVAGTDLVKIAVRAGWTDDVLQDAAAHAPDRLIGVFFAEDGDPLAQVARLSVAGFHGAMIDTRGKRGHCLTDWLDPHQLSAFVAGCRAHGLMSGLAGSLRLDHAEALIATGVGYLGFRGGLCRDGDRRGALDAERVAAVARVLRTVPHRAAA